MNDVSQATSNERLAFTVASCINVLIILFAVVLQIVRGEIFLLADAISFPLLAFVISENLSLRKQHRTMFALGTDVVIMLIGIMAMCYVLSAEVAAQRHPSATDLSAPHHDILPAGSGSSALAH